MALDVNPWIVTNLKEFMFYNCPECENFKVKSQNSFLKHAFEKHSNARECLEILSEIKTEFFNENNDYAPESSKKSSDNQNTSGNHTENSILKCEVKVESDDENESQQYYSASGKENSNSVKKYNPLPKYFPCDTCSKSFNRYSNLERHKKLVHKENSSIQNDLEDCDLDNNEIVNEENTLIQEGSDLEICQSNDKTKKTWKKSWDLNRNGHFPCSDCGRVFNRQSNLKRHINAVHKEIKNFECDQCEKSYYELFALKNHMKTIHNVVDFKTSKQSEEVKTEVSKIKIPKDNSNIGGNNNDDTSSFSKNNKKLKKKHKCDFCDNTFMNLSKLESHIKIIHDPAYQLPKIHKCGFCEEKFCKLAILKKHTLNIHKEEKYLVCSYCGKKYDQHYNYKYHVEYYHQGIRSHICDLCG